MKKTLTAVSVCAIVAIMALASGCAAGRVSPSPAPVATPRMTDTPTAAPTQPVATALPPANSPAGGSDTIEGFEEGKTVDETAMTAVKSALTAKFPDAKIKSATFETYQNKQAYHVVLEEAVDGNTDLYVFADGTVTPMSAGDTGPADGAGSSGS